MRTDLALTAFSDPDAGGVGGRALFGGGEGSGGEGSGGVSSFRGSGGGVGCLAGVRAPFLLLRFNADREYDADLGRGLYGLPSFTTMAAGLGVNLAFGTGISSATSITGLSVMSASAIPLALDVVGEMGV